MQKHQIKKYSDIILFYSPPCRKKRKMLYECYYFSFFSKLNLSVVHSGKMSAVLLSGLHCGALLRKYCVMVLIPLTGSLHSDKKALLWKP